MSIILTSKVLTCNRDHVTLYPLFTKGQFFSSPSLALSAATRTSPTRIVDPPPNNNSMHMLCAVYAYTSLVCDFVVL